MIKINKNFDDIPNSLQMPPASREAKTTQEHRKTMFDNGMYTKEEDRYCLDDIKLKLKSIYHDKCAYCEQKVESWHVEHFRPKQGCDGKQGDQIHAGYFWASLSWDNLLVICPRCNENKSSKFDLLGQRVQNGPNIKDYGSINKVTLGYDSIERPKLINPEREDPKGHFIFDSKGCIKAMLGDERADYTIKTCKLDRDYLNDERKKIIDDFEANVKSVIGDSYDEKVKEKMLLEEVKRFVQNSRKTKENDFIEFREQACYWLKDIIKEIRKQVA